MADLKISQLTSATTPLAGTEVLPIVQASTTKKVSVESVLQSVQPSGTANGVVYLNGSKVATSGAALVFDGSNLGVGVSPASDAAIHVHRAGASFPTIKITNGTTGTGNLDGLDLICGSSGEAYLYNRENQNLAIGTNNAARITVAAGGDVTVNSGNLIMGTAGKGTVFGNGSGVSFKGTLSSASVSTTPVICSESATSGGGVVYISGYNASGGNRFVALIGFRDTIVTPIYLDNNTGLVLSFTAASNVLSLATVSGTVVCSSVSLTV